MRYFMQAFTKATAVLPLRVYFACKIYYENGQKPKNRYDYIKGKTILMANHTSMWDPVLHGYLYTFREMRIWAGSNLYNRSNLFSWFLDKMGFIKVNRDIADLSAIQQAIDTLDRGGLVTIFPEGRLSPDKSPLPYKPGIAMVALRSGAPIVPIYIDGNYGLNRRVRIMVGEKIDLGQHLRKDIPFSEAFPQLCGFLSGRIQELRHKLEAATGMASPELPHAPAQEVDLPDKRDGTGFAG